MLRHGLRGVFPIRSLGGFEDELDRRKGLRLGALLPYVRAELGLDGLDVFGSPDAEVVGVGRALRVLVELPDLLPQVFERVFRGGVHLSRLGASALKPDESSGEDQQPDESQ